MGNIWIILRMHFTTIRFIHGPKLHKQKRNFFIFCIYLGHCGKWFTQLTYARNVVSSLYCMSLYQTKIMLPSLLSFFFCWDCIICFKVIGFVHLSQNFLVIECPKFIGARSHADHGNPCMWVWHYINNMLYCRMWIKIVPKTLSQNFPSK